jgi:CubicO group peptidase (beta-lactamase class C family)
MHDPPILNPERLGLSSGRLQRAYDLLQRWVETDTIPAAALVVGRRGGMVEPMLFGRRWLASEEPLRRDALFLVASLTKPVTAAAVMILVERGWISLDDHVADYVPAFAQNGKADVRIRHLLTHTSGLPDMLPENIALRAGHRPLEVFVEATCRQPLLFAPGTRVSYQSMGFVMLAEIVRQVSVASLPEFLRRELFGPLGMNDTALGGRLEWIERVAEVRLEPEQEGTNWHWNTSYWLTLGAPWGGLITSPSDYARFCWLMLWPNDFGAASRPLSLATIRAMTRNQLEALPLVPEEDRRCRPWGLGWRLNWPGYSAHFGDLLGPRAFGHWGATGTLCWIDPDADAFLVLFTTQPQGEHGRFLARVSNVVAAAF